jgi:sugar lactone lactonase YvrE
MDISYFGSIRNRLGESPLWDSRHECLWWVDILERRVFAARSDGTVERNWQFSEPVCSIGLADEGLVAAFASGFALIDEDGVATYLTMPQIGEGPLRFNDGKADRHGRFLAGTMQTDDLPDPRATLWRLDCNGEAQQVESGLRLSNAMCFSPLGDILYFADTLEGVIHRYPYDPATGALGAREDFIDTREHGSLPDGATVDAEGHLWVALVQAQSIARFSPSGALTELIEIPIPFPSCPAFGGKDLETLYVTTIADSGHRLHTDHPDGGSIVEISGLGVRGLPEVRYRRKNHI